MENSEASQACNTENSPEAEILSSGDDSTTVKRRKIGGSEVWKYFTHSNGKKIAKCRSCGKEYRTSGNTSNMFDHLKRAHPNLRGKPSCSKKINQYFTRDAKYDNNSEHKKNIDDALIWMIAADIQPFRIVEDSGFRKFVECLDPRYVLPSRTSLQNLLLKNTYNDVKKKLQVILNGTQYCAITTDCWTSRANENYLTVTCHFITDNCKLQVAVLSTNKLLSGTNHSAENISETLRNVLSEWSILHKVTSLVTDNAASMLKACEILQKRNITCFAHTINLIVQDALGKAYIKGVLVKCKHIVSYFKSSTIAYEKFKAAQCIPKPYS
ncbi:PREDICTED: zinc finger BED domain-containing protein 1-like [Rhagoletis zephyria]|uniref:zinc finger BED domain-containing protein 1-like n=1 Tax=Rhagoletis zephyria TaxID=28612 RepID=UPI0008119957|nr:PREDICTED: zinc finger BED domain-containing protein 1-like [Rhagoletis zephyria]